MLNNSIILYLNKFENNAKLLHLKNNSQQN